jgi:hypothetical protein
LSLQEIGVGLDHGLVVGSHRRILQIFLLLGLGRGQNWLHHDGRLCRRRWKWRDHTVMLTLVDVDGLDRDECSEGCGSVEKHSHGSSLDIDF